MVAVAAVLCLGMPAQALAQAATPPVFECPWTPVSGETPNANGCNGGGDDGCGDP